MEFGGLIALTGGGGERLLGHGDGFHVFVGNVSRTWEKRELMGIQSDITLGFQTSTDVISGIGLWQT